MHHLVTVSSINGTVSKYNIALDNVRRGTTHTVVSEKVDGSLRLKNLKNSATEVNLKE